MEEAGRALIFIMNPEGHRGEPAWAKEAAEELGRVGPGWSVSLGPARMAAAGLREFDEVVVRNLATGARFSTFALLGTEEEIRLNGAAALLADPGEPLEITRMPEPKGEKAPWRTMVRVEARSARAPEISWQDDLPGVNPLDRFTD
ncbi:MAG: Aspartate decarboxylase [Verrucomicrobia bacterium]|nr:Aspartate decarboxylase [Verrucomicrobiota bacterium]